MYVERFYCLSTLSVPCAPLSVRKNMQFQKLKPAYYYFILLIYAILCHMICIIFSLCRRWIHWIYHLQDPQLKLSALEFLFQTQITSGWPTAASMKLQAFEVCVVLILVLSAGELQSYSFRTEENNRD